MNQGHDYDEIGEELFARQKVMEAIKKHEAQGEQVWGLMYGHKNCGYTQSLVSYLASRYKGIVFLQTDDWDNKLKSSGGTLSFPQFFVRTEHGIKYVGDSTGITRGHALHNHPIPSYANKLSQAPRE